MPLYICGFVLLGAAFQKHLSVGALVMGWGIAEVAVMVNTVAVCALPYARIFFYQDLNALRLRCVRQRLLPEAPGRDQCAAEPHACARRFQRRILSSAMGDKERSVADARVRGCVSHLLI